MDYELLSKYELIEKIELLEKQIAKCKCNSAPKEQKEQKCGRCGNSGLAATCKLCGDRMCEHCMWYMNNRGFKGKEIRCLTCHENR